jgi:glycosyltransferase involved in cell wall biosynthesis
MKILFINAQDTKGGASWASYRLSKGLEKHYQTKNYFIVGKRHSSDTNIFCTRKNDFQVIIELLTDKVMNKLGLQYQYFPFSTKYILKKARELQPDIISLHNTHEGYFKTGLLKKLSKIAPIAWTLHDMWSFTGNAVHTFGDESWKQLRTGKGEKKSYPHIGIDTGRWLMKQKRRIYRKSDLHIITPSNWLSHLAAQSPVFENKTITTIHHGLDLDFFSPKDKTICRQALGIDLNAKLVLFSSAGDLDVSPWKGGPLMLDVLKALNKTTAQPLHFLAVGPGGLNAVKHLEKLLVHKIGYVSSQTFLPLLYSAADLFIYPTRADNSPLVLIESIACGTPAITFDIGGCSDIIKDNISGTLVKPFEISTFAQKTMQLLEDEARLKSLSSSTREFAQQKFDIADMAKNHQQLFNTLLNKRKK